ncbi:MAG TPA: class I SAM-dependent methyltransferase [Gemmatimonadaceae bacterium]|jgi:ubiquinone/menaquinone biosynthesis C-methylase UbiE|nr:class I SAM-dependent methyltransferase [Gemmatimonadaceae bacterium]
MVRAQLRELYWKVERLIVPGLKYSQETYEEELFRIVQPGMVWLDLGCGRSLLPPWRSEGERRLTARARSLVGVDPDLAALGDNRSLTDRVAGNASRLPFRDRIFDLVTANMVVEHLADPVSQFREIARVLRPGGRFVFHTPNARGYDTLAARMIPEFAKKGMLRVLEGRHPEDVYPTFYRANTPRQVESASSQAGLRVESIKLFVSTAATASVLPLAIVELFWIRLLMTEPLRGLRPNSIVILSKAAD